MNFGQLLHAAQQNDKNKREIRYYSTKYEPPKKEQKSKQLSANIQKFLARQKEEEQRKLEEERRKKEELLSLRAQDKKATRRVNVMLKSTKSANKSAIMDAVDKDNTAITLAGPIQPDEDDYGYVSQEAAAFYQKMMEKYSKMPEESKFSLTKKRVSTNLSNTKDRVKAALEKEKEDALLPHRRKRRNKEGIEYEEEPEDDTPRQNKPKAKPPPPPMNFADLLKIAEKKQFEPIVIEQKPKEEEKPLTKKQKKELEREKEWRERKEARENMSTTERLKEASARIPKLSDKQSKPNNLDSKISKPVSDKPKPSNIPRNDNLPSQKKPISSLNGKSDIINSVNKKLSGELERKTPNSSKSLPTKGPITNASSINKNSMVQKSIPSSNKMNGATKTPTILPRMLNGQKSRELVTNKDIKPKKFPPDDLRPKPNIMKPKEFPPKDLKPKQFPPADVRRNDMPPPGRKLKGMPPPRKRKSNVIDDDSEYDSEMDDFIDDGPEENNDYSKYISEIFGYDKNRYRDYEDDDVDNMESTFAQQMREEIRSTKIGIMEDLEDMRMEEEAKRRKAMLKKRKL